VSVHLLILIHLIGVSYHISFAAGGWLRNKRIENTKILTQIPGRILNKHRAAQMIAL